MSTPSKKATGHVSTPSHPNNSSPAPRSVPSPATTRKEQAGKTPVNHPTGSSFGSKTLGGTPMMHNLSQQGNALGSPGANMLGFGTPVGLGVEGITPTSGAAMMPTMSDLGFTTSGSGRRNEDEERRTRMRKVLKTIGRSKGRVGEEGIARVARRVGFQNDIDLETLTLESRERKVGNRVISVAGNKLIIEIALKSQVPQSVQLLFDSENKSLIKEQAPAASIVLLEDLRAPDGIALNGKLDRFAINLERLARVDRLSNNHLNCFEAISGIFTSLSRLYEHEMQIATQLEVMCKKSGRPKMHARGRLGLSIEYWQGNRCTPASKSTGLGTKVDSDDKRNDVVMDEAVEVDIFRLHIETEVSSAGLYPPVRVSEFWLPDPLEIPATDSGDGIPWQDPPPTLVPGSNGAPEAMAVDGDQKLPDLRFIAKLVPPVVMPFGIAAAVLATVGVTQPQIFEKSPHFQTILLDPTATLLTARTNKTTFNGQQTVLRIQGSKETEVTHDYAVEIAKPEYGFRMEELPFSHPRQLVEVLPVLRQWAAFGSLVSHTLEKVTTHSENLQDVDGNVFSNGVTQLSLADILTPPSTPDLPERLPITVALATSPTPTLAFEFPVTGNVTLESINVQILHNADTNVSKPTADGTALDIRDRPGWKKLAKALDVCGDLGVWLEWQRGKLLEQ